MEPPRADEPSACPQLEGALALRTLLSRPEPMLALAPMQDVPDVPFRGVMAH